MTRPNATLVSDQERQTPSAWRFLLPWALLPLALAIVTLADWLSHRRGRGK